MSSADNTPDLTMNAAGDVSLRSGVAISGFSSDGTLSRNRDTAVPTEAAVRKYVDRHLVVQGGDAPPAQLNVVVNNVLQPRDQFVYVRCPARFPSPPVVSVAIEALDVRRDFNQRIEVWAQNVTVDGFTVQYLTEEWADTRIFWVQASWIAHDPL